MLANPWQPQGVVIAHESTTFFPANPNVLYEGNSQLGLTGNVLKMWYCNVVSPYGLYYAESSDGGATWTQDGSNPILAGIGYPKIFKSGTTYYLYCCVGLSGAAIKAYTSPDGVTWTLQNATALVPSQSWENGNVYQLGVAGILNGTWYGYYSGGNLNGSGYLTGLATSADGLIWTKDAGNPVASMSGGNMNAGGPWLGAGNFWFLRVGTKYYGWSQTTLTANPGAPSGTYHGNVPSDIMRWSATSPAGPWTPLGSLTYYRTLANEGITTGGTAATALGQVADPTLTEINGVVHLFYTATPDGEGLATYFEINHAIANTSLASLVNGAEGVQNVPIPFPGGSRSVNFSNAIASDNFVRASLGTNWTQEVVGASFSPGTITTDKAGSSVVSKPSYEFYNATLPGADQWAQSTLFALTHIGDQILTSVRNDPGAAGTVYNGILYGSAGGTGVANNQLYLQKYVAGALTNLAFFTGITAEVGDEISISACGSTLSLYYNGYLMLVCSDGSISFGAGGWGATCSVSIADALISAWAGGNANQIPVYASGKPPLNATDETNIFSISPTSWVGTPRVLGTTIE